MAKSSLHPDLAALAEQFADMPVDDQGRTSFEFDDHGLTAFALAVARAERERCATACLTPFGGPSYLLGRAQASEAVARLGNPAWAEPTP
jgi:hypothetical protein